MHSGSVSRGMSPSLSIFRDEDCNDNTSKPTGAQSLKSCFTLLVLPEFDERAEATLQEYQATLRLWERLTDNPPARTITREIVTEFRDKLVSTNYTRGRTTLPRSAATVNKIMRTLRAIIRPLWPKDTHNEAGLGLVPLFKFPKNLRVRRGLPRTFTRKQLSALYLACDGAKPLKGFRRSVLHNADAWRTAIVLGLNAGPRTWDLFSLQWDDVDWDDFRYGSISFQARKTDKAQRIPLNLSARRHLEYWRKLNPKAVGVFEGFKKSKTFYVAWARICERAQVECRPFETFRKTCNTLHEDVRTGVGKFILGHELQGVNAQHYDDPTKRVWQTIYKLQQPKQFVLGARSIAARMAKEQTDLAK